MQQQGYSFPDDMTLAKYLALLRAVILEARAAAYLGNSELAAELMDAIENVPDLLTRWPDMEESVVWSQLEQTRNRVPSLQETLDRIRGNDFGGLLHAQRDT